MKELLLIISVIISTFVYSQTVEEVKQEIKNQKLKFTYIVLAQSILECGWEYESYNARERHNLFGLVKPDGSGYFEFNTWEQSVSAYKHKVQYRYQKGSYYNFLDSIGYASDPKYINKLKWIVKKLKD